MANGEHLALLRQGVDGWNEWRANNPQIRPNLSFATGNGITIKGPKLSGVDLSRTNLSRADFSKADLIGVNLSDANLSEAYLSEVDLIGADLIGADLKGADLMSANLIGAILSQVYLSGANLSLANLSGADLIEAKLIGANLSGANLSGANLKGANLSGANLSGANLKGANLSGANLKGANLSGANLQKTKAPNANFHKAILTGVCLEDWHINSATNLDEVICDYVYLKANRKERCPEQGNLASGEFAKLFQKPLETVDLVFRNGIDWQAFLTSFQKLQVKGGGSELSIQAIENKPNGSFIIRINLPPDTDKEVLENYLKREYVHELKAIDREYRYQLQVGYEQIAAYRQQSANLTEIVKLMACRTINVEARTMVEPTSVSEATKDDQLEAQIDGFINAAQGNTPLQSISHNPTLEQEQRLADAAVKIQNLLQKLEQTYHINTPLEKQIVVTEVIKRIESNPSLKVWMIGILKGVSTEALKKLIDHPLVNVLLAALEDYQEVD